MPDNFLPYGPAVGQQEKTQKRVLKHLVVGLDGLILGAGFPGDVRLIIYLTVSRGSDGEGPQKSAQA
ncbi:hypothetical protein ACFL5V_10715 [Fibrobacterota bacterium]